MEQLSFFEKLGVLGSNILAHPLFILLLLSPVVIIALNKKITKKFIIAIYIAIILIVLFVGNTTLFALLDNMIDGLFMVLYFPNFITLFIVVVASAIITLITFFRKKMLKVNKVINITGFAIIQTIFCLILVVVQANNIDIYEENALYSSNDVLTLMQLLMGTFALQILGVLIFTAIEKITEKLDAKDNEGKVYRNIEKAKELNSDAPEMLFETANKKYEPKLEKQAPLDKSLIEKEKIKPISLVDAISEENRQNVIKIGQSKNEPFKMPPVINTFAPKEINKFVKTAPIENEKPQNKVGEIKPETNQIVKQSENKFIKSPEPIVATSKAENITPENISTIKSENIITPEIFETPKDIVPTPKIETKPKAEKAPLKPGPIPQALEPKTETKNEPQELITNLVIVNLDKTIKAIRNIKRLYTM